MAVRVVIDTNIFISSFFGGIPRKVIDLWKRGRLTLCLSEPILSEYLDVIGRFNLSDEEVRELLWLFKIRRNIKDVSPTRKVRAIKDDPADNKFLECALEAKADYIVSGNEHLKKLGTYKGIRILPPVIFYELIKRI